MAEPTNMKAVTPTKAEQRAAPINARYCCAGVFDEMVPLLPPVRYSDCHSPSIFPQPF